MKKVTMALALLGSMLSATESMARIQIMGPYRHQIQKTIIENHGGKAAALIIDLHSVPGCTGDANYKQSQIANNVWYIEISPFKDPTAVCLPGKVVQAGSIVELPSSMGNAAITVWINDLRDSAEHRSVEVLDQQGQDLVSARTQSTWIPFSMVRFYDYDSNAFTAKWQGSLAANNTKYSSYKLDFSYATGGEVYESDNHLLLLNPANPVANSGSQSFSAGTPGQFRNPTLFIELPAGVDAKSLTFTTH